MATDHNPEEVELPRVLRIEPSSQCNLTCTHCPTGTVEMSRTIMKEEVFIEILETIKKNKFEVVVLYHGGEPLMNKNFFKMASSIRTYLPSAFIKTVSNGMILNARNVEKLIQSDLDLIEFSLDGESSEHSDQIRRNSSSERIVENIKYLLASLHNKSSKLKVAIATTQFIQEGQQFPLNSPRTPDWLKSFFGDEVTYKPTYAVRWPHMKILNKSSNNGSEKIYDLITDPASLDKNKCDHTVDTITVRANGDVVPCCYDLTSKLVLGNILSKSLVDIWNSSKYYELRQSFETKKYKSICNTCAVVRPPVYLLPRPNTV